MSTALVIGGMGFIGTPAVEHFLEQGYDVAVLSRGEHVDSRVEMSKVAFQQGDRT